ncbi:MAG: DUF4446 family protein [Oscillospiraceae bacterium]|nr:DUF4446 family protein [Oscillospiraceae bacterium]
METLSVIVNSYVFNLILGGVTTLLLILFISTRVKLSKLNRNHVKFMKKLGNGNNIEEILKKYVKQVEEVTERTEDLRKYCGRLESEMTTCIQRIGMVRYSAFKDTGSDLSFALALLDDNKNGVLLNGIYSREMSNIYAKQVIKGEAVNKVSDEEKRAIEIAITQNKGYKKEE